MAFEHLMYRLQRVIQLLFLVCRHQGETDQGILRGDRGSDHGINEDARLEQFLNDQERQVVVANEQGDDRG